MEEIYRGEFLLKERNGYVLHKDKNNVVLVLPHDIKTPCGYNFPKVTCSELGIAKLSLRKEERVTDGIKYLIMNSDEEMQLYKFNEDIPKESRKCPICFPEN